MVKSLLIREVQTKTTPTKMATIQKLMIPSVDKYVEQLEVSPITSKMWQGTAHLENNLAVSLIG